LNTQQGETKMKDNIPPNSAHLASLAGRLQTEINAGDVVGKIDWSKILALLAEILPIILAFLADKQRSE
jgi:hypothetical protein